MKFSNFVVLNVKNVIIWAVLALLVFGNVMFAVSNYFQAQEIERLEQQVAVQQTNTDIVNFLNLFIKKVLKAQGEVPFEERLQLENAIRNIDAAELLATWEHFTESQTDNQVQNGVKDLLEALVARIVVN